MFIWALVVEGTFVQNLRLIYYSLPIEVEHNVLSPFRLKISFWATSVAVSSSLCRVSLLSFVGTQLTHRRLCEVHITHAAEVFAIARHCSLWGFFGYIRSIDGDSRVVIRCFSNLFRSFLSASALLCFSNYPSLSESPVQNHRFHYRRVSCYSPSHAPPSHLLRSCREPFVGFHYLVDAVPLCHDPSAEHAVEIIGSSLCAYVPMTSIHGSACWRRVQMNVVQI